MTKLFNFVQYGLAVNCLIYLLTTYLDMFNYFHAFFVIPFVMALHVLYTLKYMFDYQCTKFQQCMLFALFYNCMYFKMYYNDMTVQNVALLVALSAANLGAIVFSCGGGGGSGSGEKKDN